ncbi:MAG: hypothetical protein KIT09_27260 [Bryobacteraceae bacterium]|nr:hypothetical protein [Bryobacteraceae bacterium]
MREYEARFVRLEERILRESAELRTETKRRLDSLEAFMRQELDSLADRLAAERNERTGAVERLTREFGESTSALEKKLFQSDDQFARNLRELRQLMSDRQKDLLEEFSRKTTDASSLAERRIEEVRTSSVPRSSLAGLLTEIALRIEGQFSLPHPEGPGNGGADG